MIALGSYQKQFKRSNQKSQNVRKSLRETRCRLFKGLLVKRHKILFHPTGFIDGLDLMVARSKTGAVIKALQKVACCLVAGFYEIK